MTSNRSEEARLVRPHQMFGSLAFVAAMVASPMELGLGCAVLVLVTLGAVVIEDSGVMLSPAGAAQKTAMGLAQANALTSSSH